MDRKVSFQNESGLKDFQEFSENKLAIAKVCVLSTAPNSHELNISEKVLRRDIGTIRGNFLVAHMFGGDAHSHDKEEVPVGYFIPNKDIEFEEVEENGSKVVKAWAYAVLSKQYAKEAYDMFTRDNHRATSIEMAVELGEDEHEVVSFDAYGSTILGMNIKPSCKDAEISLVRFAEEAESFFSESSILSDLEKFVEDRKKSMAEKYVSHPINTSKEAVYEGEWDGNKAKQDLVKEKNYKTLAPKVCLRLEPGWEDREVTKLGYPVMGLYDGEWRYSAKALASAQGYAEKENETEVLKKIKAIKKKLGLDDSNGKEETKMSKEIEFAAVDIGDMWSCLWHEIDNTRHWEYSIVGIYEEDNKKFAVLRDRDGKLYRLDFSMTEDGMTVAKEVVEVKQEFIVTENIKQFAEPENVADYRFAEKDDKDDDNDTHDDDDEHDDDENEDFEAKCAQLTKDIEERDNIIMEKDAKIGEYEKELADLREYKRCVEASQLACKVEEVLSSVEKFANDEQMSTFREEGKKCTLETIADFENKVKAICFENVKKKKSKEDDMIKMSINLPKTETESGDIWTRLENKYNK